MKIAILGGAFDPPHIGHYLVARQVKEMLAMDEVWFMVCQSYFPEFPDKMMKITKFEDRYHMASFFNDGNGQMVSDFEHRSNPRSRTIDTLRMLKKKHPRDSFSWIIGSDTLPTFHLWNEWQALVSEERFIVFPRDTDFVTLKSRVKKAFRVSSIPSNITVMEGKLIVSNVASTHIRGRVRNGLPIEHLVLPQVNDYIRKHNLYV